MSERARSVTLILVATIVAVAVVVGMTVLANSITSTRATVEGSVEVLAPRSARPSTTTTITTPTSTATTGTTTGSTGTTPTNGDDAGRRDRGRGRDDDD